MLLRHFVYCAVLLSLISSGASLGAPPKEIPFEEGWRIQSSRDAGVLGQKISQASYDDSSWHEARVPSTILANLTDDSIFYGDRILTLMGTAPFSPTSPEEAGIFVGETPADSPFAAPWWYRRVFTVPADLTGQNLELTLDGITYGAEVWVNGVKIANANDTLGTYRAFRFEIASLLNAPGLPNAVAVLVSPPHPHDLTMSWVDWNITPQDKNMGLWRGASLRAHGLVRIEHPFVQTSLPLLPSTARADLTVEAELTNTSDQPVSGQARGRIGNITFSTSVTLAANETKTVTFSPKAFPELSISHPPLWWPAQMGRPRLQHLTLEFTAQGDLTDRAELDFGIRQITSGLNPQGSRQFYVNGKPILIRGGGWAPDLFLRASVERIEKEMNYVLDMGLNTIRLEGTMQPEHFYAQADRKGILVMPGVVCCIAWQMDEEKWTPQTLAIAKASVKDFALATRAHASSLAFLYGSDDAPSPVTEQAYLDALSKVHWPNPTVSSAATSETDLGGDTGFKMRGPYDYTAPSYWFVDKTQGGAFGFNTETSPGPSMPALDELRKFMTPEDLDHFGPDWKLHAGRNGFANIDLYLNALQTMYGPIRNIPDMVSKAQIMDYSDHRAMFEAFNRNKHQGATGVVQWMLNNAWPSVIWHLYDYYLAPGAAYFGVKEANRALHVLYGYDNGQVSLVNSTYRGRHGLRAQAKVYDLDSHLISSQESGLTDVEANGSVSLFAVQTPPANLRGGIELIDLTLKDFLGTVIDRNFYWVSTTKPPKPLDVGDPEADFTALQTMAPASLTLHGSWDAISATETVHVKNPGNTLAFFVRLRLTDATGDTDLLPVIWEDNDLTLAPAEERVIHATIPSARGAAEPRLTFESWNVSR